jgi:probable HAF family extracellular repeat protein
MNTRIRTTAFLAVLTLIPALAGAAETVIELPTLGGSYAQAEDINDNGQIVGWSERVGGSVEATIWEAGVASSLGLPHAARFSFGTAINNVGEVTGYSEIGVVPRAPGNSKSAAFWGTTGIVDIGAAMGFSDSMAYDINDNGVVALQGDHPGPFGITTGYVWNETFGGTQAGPNLFYRFGGNHGINNLNDVVGLAAAGFDGQQAILATFNGFGWDLGTEIGPQAVRAPATANAISDSGIVVGQGGNDGVHVSEAVVFTRDKARPVVWLDTLDDFEHSDALDLNEAGTIVGFAVHYEGATPELRAVVWVDETIYDLNHLLSRRSSFRILVRATGVNENGDIVGYGELFNGDVRPFVIPQLGHGPSSNLFGHPRTPASLD